MTCERRWQQQMAISSSYLSLIHIFDAQYAKEQDALEIEIAELEKAVTGYEQSQKSAEKFIALIDKYENFDTLTNTMLNEFVEKILVHERARKGSQDTTQEIEILSLIHISISTSVKKSYPVSGPKP